MKKILPAFLLLVFFANQSKAQLTAHAGVDFSYCDNQNAGPWTGFSVATGGTPPYTYAWSPASALSDSTLEHPAPTATVTTTYTVVVTDNLGATATDTIVVTVYHAPTAFVFASDTNVCGSTPITFTGSGCCGTPPYTYDWDFNDGSTANFATPVHAYNAQGLYQPGLTVTDANGCYSFSSIYVSVSQLNVTAMLTPIICFGANDGSMLALINSGTPPYTFLWSNGATTQTITNLSAGTYSVTVMDSHQCTGGDFNTLTEPSAITVTTTVTDESSAGSCDGAISAIVSGGYTPYTYAWSPGGITTQSASALCAGNYILTVTDSNGCSASGFGAVASGACTNNTLVVSINSQDLSCTHPQDTLTVNISGGTPPYNYQWTTGDTAAQTIATQGGIYEVYITDDSGCVKTAVDTLLNNGLNVIQAYTNSAGCNGNPNGAAAVNVSGGTPPYTFLWSNGGTNDSIAGVTPGVYRVTVTDATSCSQTLALSVGQNNTNWSYYVFVNTTAGNCANNSTATALVNGGTAPYTFLWNNGDTTQTISGLSTNYYTVTVTGADGCTRTGAASVYSNCSNIITGNVFSDTNLNCLKDSGEAAISGLYVTATNQLGNTTYGTVYSNGTYTIYLSTAGNYTVTLVSYSWGNSCAAINICGAQTANFISVGDTAVLNFGVGSTSGYNLALHPGWSSANPGFPKEIWILPFNHSYTPFTGTATVTFVYDSNLVYQSSGSPLPVHNAATHTLTWTLSSSSIPSPSYDWYSRLRNFFLVPASLPIGYLLQSDFYITPTSGDCDSSDNHLHFSEICTGSLDPNEKEVSPAGDIQEEDSVLTYTIHFQNTGTDTTWFITVVDTLSVGLDPATVQNLASSHDYASFNVSGSGILTWLFNPIFLVDSFTNEPASKGFVSFRVKKKAGLPLNTEITNRASIYFDYNEPIITNTVSSKLTDPNSISNLNNEVPINVNVIPNPFTQVATVNVEGVTGAYNFELFDVSGKKMKSITGINASRFTINRDAMSTGVYFYSITTSTKQKAFGKLMVQ